MSLSCPHCGGALVLSLAPAADGAVAPEREPHPATGAPWTAPPEQVRFTMQQPRDWNGPLVDAATWGPDATGLCLLRYRDGALEFKGPHCDDAFGRPCGLASDGWYDLTSAKGVAVRLLLDVSDPTVFAVPEIRFPGSTEPQPAAS